MYRLLLRVIQEMLVEYASRYLEMQELASLDASACLQNLKGKFAYELMNCIFFNQMRFTLYIRIQLQCEEWNFKHVTDN